MRCWFTRREFIHHAPPSRTVSWPRLTQTAVWVSFDSYLLLRQVTHFGSNSVSWCRVSRGEPSGVPHEPCPGSSCYLLAGGRLRHEQKSVAAARWKRKVPPLLLRRRPVIEEAHDGTTAIDHDLQSVSTQNTSTSQAEVEVFGLGVLRIGTQPPPGSLPGSVLTWACLQGE